MSTLFAHLAARHAPGAYVMGGHLDATKKKKKRPVCELLGQARRVGDKTPHPGWARRNDEW